MTGYLIGGLGLLAGVVVGLWYRYRYAKAQGKISVLQLKMAARDDKYEVLDKKLETSTAKFDDALKRKDKLLETKIQKIKGLRELCKKSRSPVVRDERYRMLFSDEDEDSGEAGTSSGT